MRQCADCCKFDSEYEMVSVPCDSKVSNEGHAKLTTASPRPCDAFIPIGKCEEDLGD